MAVCFGDKYSYEQIPEFDEYEIVCYTGSGTGSKMSKLTDDDAVT